MDCCKETKYNILLKFNPTQKLDESFLSTVTIGLESVMGYSKTQSESAVNFAIERDHYLLSRDIRDNITRISLKLAEHNIPHEVKLSMK